ncbi:MAG: hypothetical protein LR008_03610 [Candidatus Pacebacteria bacterium]|nr:hypothetical protein [Candidatus Paceibacterota bacterium]
MKEYFSNKKIIQDSEEVSLPDYSLSESELASASADELKSRIDNINASVQNHSLDTDLTNEQVASLKNEIYHQENKSNIDELKAQIDKINTAVQNGTMGTTKADEMVEVLEQKIYKYENLSSKTEGNYIDNEVPKVSDVEYESIEDEYLQLKHEFRAAENDFYEKLEEDYSDRNVANRLFGLKRDLDGMSPEARAAYDNYISSNNAYFKFAQESGQYQKIAERLNRDKDSDDAVQIDHAVADRHLLRAAEKRLSLQTESFMPAPLAKVKNSIVNWISASKKRQVGALLSGAVINLPGLAAGWMAGKIQSGFADAYAAEMEAEIKNAENTIMQDSFVDLDQMEDIFESMNNAQKERTKAKVYATGAAVGAGVAFPDAGLTTVLTEDLPAVVSEVQTKGIDSSATDEAVTHAIDELTKTPDELVVGTVSAEAAPVISEAPSELIHDVVTDDANENTLEEIKPAQQEIVQSEITSTKYPGEHISRALEMRLKGWASETDAVMSGGAAEETLENLQSVEQPVDVSVPTEQTESVTKNKSFYEQLRSHQPEPVDNAESVDTTSTETQSETVGNVDSNDSATTEVQTASEEIVVTNEAKHVSREDILAERELTQSRFSHFQTSGEYQPKIIPELDKLVTSPAEGQHIFEHVYQEMLKAYQEGSLNLPAERESYVSANETALYSFIEESAKELVNNRVSVWFGGSESLELTSGQWQDLGFSSGDPQELVAGDKIQTGELIKLILENAAKDINAKFN